MDFELEVITQYAEWLHADILVDIYAGEIENIGIARLTVNDADFDAADEALRATGHQASRQSQSSH